MKILMILGILGLVISCEKNPTISDDELNRRHNHASYLCSVYGKDVGFNYKVVRNKDDFNCYSYWGGTFTREEMKHRVLAILMYKAHQNRLKLQE